MSGIALSIASQYNTVYMTYIPDGSVANTKVGIMHTPSTTGVYIFRTSTEIVYIGKAVSIKSRLLSHLQSASMDKKEAAIFAESDTIEYVITDSEFKALVLEAHLISTIKPKYNVRWRDDKSYLYIKITTGELYPKVSLARKQDIAQIPNHKHQIPNNIQAKKIANVELGTWNFSCFGPFASTRSAESVLRYLRKIVPYCTQKNISKTPCFYSKIGQCDPCPNNIEKMQDPSSKSREKRRYRHQIKILVKILEGNIDGVKKDFRKQIAEYTERQDFEAAIKARDAMRRLKFMIQHGSFRLDEYESYNNSQKSAESLQTLLQEFYPDLHIGRIECYDNSTLGFSNSTASMVVFTDGLVDKKEYKRFKLGKLPASVSRQDSDFDMMKEVMIRRQRNTKWPKPDLIVIDGGVPQLRAVMEAISRDKSDSEFSQPKADSHGAETLNSQLSTIPLIGIAKNPDRIVIPVSSHPERSEGSNTVKIHAVTQSDFITLRPSSNDLGFRLIQSIRDEAHRFAKKYHTYLRKQSLLG